MRTRNWIAVMSLFVFIVAAVVVGQSTLATPELKVKVELELNALSPVFPSGGQADLEVPLQLFPFLNSGLPQA